MKGKKIFIILAVLIIIVIVIMTIGKKNGAFGKREGLKVEAEKPQFRKIVEKITANGKVQPETEVKISPDVSGEIVELNIKEGDYVNKGKLLLKIKPDTYISMRDRANAALNSAKARLAISKAQFEKNTLVYQRNKSLWEQKAISDSDYENALSAYTVSKAEVEAAEFNVKSSEASLKEAQENLVKTTIYAPMSGTVSKLNVELGERVVGTAQMAGTEIMRIADLNRMEVKVDVNENDIVRVKLGDVAEIEVDAYIDRTFKGIVTEIANSASITGGSADQVTTFDVKILVLEESYADLTSDNRKPFRPGMSASVDIITKEINNALSVPIQAVTIRGEDNKNPNVANNDFAEVNNGGEQKEDDRDDMKEIVFLVNADKTVKSVEVKTGIQDDKYIEIKTGIDTTALLVSGPYSAVSKKLKDGMTVETKKKNNQIRKVI